MKDAVAVMAVFFLTRESTREVVVRALPAIGFGSGAQTSLGLRLLVNETPADQFRQLADEVKAKINFETNAALSPSPTMGIRRRLELVDQVLSYSYQGAGVDLKKDAEAGLRTKLDALQSDAIGKIAYEKNIAHNGGDKKKEDLMREIKLLLAQKQFPELLQKVLPLWNSSEAINLAAVVGIVEMKLKDPRSLEDVLRAHSAGLNVNE
jgi:hypothetical protein